MTLAVDARPRRALLVSSVNGGGVLHVAAVEDGGGVEWLSKIDTTALVAVPAGMLWARQAEGLAELRVVRGDTVDRLCLVQASLDLHDILCHDGRLYVVCTELNAVVELDAGTYTESRRWTLPGEPDSPHVNSVCVHDGRLLASRFGPFEHHRGYKGRTRGAGEVYDLDTGEVLVSGLSQPHSLKSFDGLLWLCDSEAHTLRAYRDFVEEIAVELGGYARGLVFDGPHVCVGLSRGRNDPDSALASARIVVLDRAQLQVRDTIALPVDEIYDLLAIDAPLADLRTGALRDAFAEVHAQRLRADGVTGALHQTHGRIDGLQRHVGALDTTLAQERRRRADLDARVDEDAIWIGLLDAETVRLRALIARQAEQSVEQRALIDRQTEQLAERHALVVRQAEALVEQREFIDSVIRSRSWRWTRLLRRTELDVPAPRVGMAAVADAVSAVTLSDIEPDAVATADAGPRRSMVPVLGLAFTEHADPQVSIVVTAYGNFAQTLDCLRAIRDAGDRTPFEVILIEDASGDDEMGRFAHVPGLRYRANPVNLGFLRSANQAAALARGHFVHLLNNDTQVCSGWLDALVQTFALFHECGIAGSKLVYPDGRLQECGGIVWSDGDACNYGRGDDPHRPQYAAVREVDYVSGASIMLPTALLRELGGFDERYLPAYYEDTDLAFRVREAGYRVYVQPTSVVVHHEGLSHGTDIGAGIKASQVRNRAVFLDRWRAVLSAGQLRSGEHMFLARDRAQLSRVVLLVDRYPPEPDRDAGSRAIWQLMRVLFLQGFRIKFWADRPGDDPVYAASLRMHGIEMLSSQDSGPFDDWIAIHGGYLDTVILSRPMVARDYIGAVRRHTACAVVYYGHDIHAQRAERQHAFNGDPALKTQAGHARRVEHALWRQSDLVLYPSDEETRHVREWLSAHAPTVRAETVPLFAYEGVSLLDPQTALAPDARHELLFVGGFAHAPNADGARWFAREVWPLARARCPGLRLCLVGPEPTADVAALAADDVEVTGYISEAELIARYARARVVVAPLRFGAGTKGKVLEAMRYGVPCVTTPTGAQGLADAMSLRIGDDAASMTAQIAALVEDAAAWWHASREGQEYVRSRFSVQAVWHALSGTMDARGYPDVQARRDTLAARAASTRTAA